MWHIVFKTIIHKLKHQTQRKRLIHRYWTAILCQQVTGQFSVGVERATTSRAKAKWLSLQSPWKGSVKAKGGRATGQNYDYFSFRPLVLFNPCFFPATLLESLLFHNLVGHSWVSFQTVFRLSSLTESAKP
jgi:hypothetical protein